MNRWVRFAFNQFYTRFAWSYDAVARAVSFGEWQLWGRAALQFLPQGRDARILEIGHGPGHLHVLMRQRGMRVAGIDLSAQMSRMTQRRLLRALGSQQSAELARADAQALPFPDQLFDAVVSTFPAEFIFASTTLKGIARVLKPGGRLVVVPTAGFRGSGAATRLVEVAYRATGQRAALAAVEARAAERLSAAGLTFESARVRTPRADVVVWISARA